MSRPQPSPLTPSTGQVTPPSFWQVVDWNVLGEKFLLWILLNVSIGLLPLLLRYLFDQLHKKPSEWEGLLSDGELFVIASALGAGALGELYRAPTGYRTIKTLITCFCVLCIVLAAVLYGYLQAFKNRPGELDPSFLSFLSFGVYGGCFLASCACLVMSETK